MKYKNIILLERLGYPTITLEYYRDNVDTPIVNFYRKIYVEEMLSTFANNNLNQIVLSAFKTNEITKYARKFSVEHYFDDILGTQNIIMESKTARGIRYMQERGFAPEQTLYIGDTVHDYETASDLGVDCILFSGGQQSPKLLKRCGVPVCDSFVDIAKQLTVDM